MPDDIKRLKTEVKRLRKALSELSPSLDVMLKLRGFKIYKKEPSEDLLLPKKKYQSSYHEKLKKYSFRLFLRDVIKSRQYFTVEKVTRFSTAEVTSAYIDFLIKAGIAESFRDGYRLKITPVTPVRKKAPPGLSNGVKSFGGTLEWFIAGLLARDFQAETIWGVKFKGHRAGGDYDLIAKIDAGLLYMEIKSSPPKQIYDREVAAFLNRIEDLMPEISIFFVDTELRMKDKIVPMFEAELKKRLKKPPRVKRIEKELFHINKKIFIINSKPDVSANISAVLGFKWHKNKTKQRGM